MQSTGTGDGDDSAGSRQLQRGECAQGDPADQFWVGGSFGSTVASGLTALLWRRRPVGVKSTHVFPFDRDRTEGAPGHPRTQGTPGIRSRRRLWSSLGLGLPGGGLGQVGVTLARKFHPLLSGEATLRADASSARQPSSAFRTIGKYREKLETQKTNHTNPACAARLKAKLSTRGRLQN